jgi:HSP20 family protein
MGRGAGTGETGIGTWMPPVEVRERNGNLEITAELPGMTRDKLNIFYSDGMLTLSGERSPLPEEKGMTLIRQERSLGHFEKSVRIPAKIVPEKINALFSNGILTVTLPKAEEAKTKKILIEAK